MSAYIQGFLISLGLIVAIGAQNIYVLKKGLLKEFVFIIASICFFIDALFIVVGVKGIGKFLEFFPSFLTYITWFGIIFLSIYGFLALISAFKKHTMGIDTKPSKKSTLKTILTILSLSLLNPHVYLDTIILIGTIGNGFKGIAQNFFIFGAVTSSFVWFFSLSYGSRVLIPLFKKSITWKLLDIFTAFVMFFVAYNFYVNS